MTTKYHVLLVIEKKMPNEEKPVEVFAKSVDIIVDFLQDIKPDMLEWVAKRNAASLIGRLAEHNLVIEEVTGEF